MYLYQSHNVYLFKDFGAYSKSVYSVQTTEGEAIRCLISGYVEITQKSSIQPDFPMREEHTAIMSKGYICMLYVTTSILLAILLVE